MPSIGVIDGFKSRLSFHGWFSGNLEDQSRKARVEFELDGRTLASTTQIRLAQKSEERIVFNIELREPLSSRAISEGTVTAFLVSDVGKMGEIGFYKPMIDRLRDVEFAERVRDSTDDFLLQLLRTMGGGEQTSLKRKLSKFVQNANSAKSGMMLSGSQNEFDDASLVRLRPGQLSHDGSVVVGERGYLFLIGGTNHVLQQYGDTAAGANDISLAESWIKLFSTRKNKSMDMNFKYIQIIIPEKISVLPHLFPIDVKAPGLVLGEIERRMESEPHLLASYVSCLQVFNDREAMHGIFRQIDTHLSPEGCIMLMRALLEKGGHKLDREFLYEGKRLRRGDLAAKFDGIEMYDELPMVAQRCIADWEIGMRCVSREAADNDKHIGTKAVWKNPSAPIKQKLVVFGNSFFQVGDSADVLSWWCARFFEEFHFVWSPELDYNYLEDVKPDLVICQTIERFLQRVPEQ